MLEMQHAKEIHWNSLLVASRRYLTLQQSTQSLPPYRCSNSLSPMGDDLADEWEANGLDSASEDEMALAAASSVKKVAPKGGEEIALKMTGAKRGRSQLSLEDVTDSAGEGGNSGRLYEGSQLKAAEEEEEAKRRRVEKRKAKFKALKAKLKEKKQRGLETGSGGGARTDREKGERIAKEGKAPPGAAELWAAFCKVRGELVTPLEMEHPWIVDQAMARVEGFGSQTLVKLVGFIKASLPDWKKRTQNKKARSESPSVVIVCSGARRCVQVMKHLTAFRCQVLKLFAKHLKVEEQKVMLKKGCFPLAVGTPARIRTLAACGSLRLDMCALLLLDIEKNVKGRNVLDMDGVAEDTMTLLADHVKPLLASSGVSEGAGREGMKGDACPPLRIALYGSSA